MPVLANRLANSWSNQISGESRALQDSWRAASLESESLSTPLIMTPSRYKRLLTQAGGPRIKHLTCCFWRGGYIEQVFTIVQLSADWIGPLSESSRASAGGMFF